MSHCCSAVVICALLLLAQDFLSFIPTARHYLFLWLTLNNGGGVRIVFVHRAQMSGYSCKAIISHTESAGDRPLITLPDHPLRATSFLHSFISVAICECIAVPLLSLSLTYTTATVFQFLCQWLTSFISHIYRVVRQFSVCHSIDENRMA